MTICDAVLRRVRNVTRRSCRENQNTLFMYNNFLRKSYRLWANVEKCGRAGQAKDDSIIRRMRLCVLGATDTHSEFVTLIAFPQQQWLQERSSTLRLYIYCLVAFEGVE